MQVLQIIAFKRQYQSIFSINYGECAAQKEPQFYLSKTVDISAHKKLKYQTGNKTAQRFKFSLIYLALVCYSYYT